MYVTIREAVEHLAVRQRDADLRRRTVNFLGGNLPEGMPETGIAILPRQIATCRQEDLAFIEAATGAGLEPWWPTYPNDRFTTGNPDKKDLVCPRVHKGGDQFEKYKLVKDTNALDQARLTLREVRIDGNGEPGTGLFLEDLHASLREAVFPEYAGNTFDLSDWYAWQASRNGAPAGSKNICEFYYQAYWALCVPFCVMFDDYHGGPNGCAKPGGFLDRIALPAFQAVSQALGLQPLIVQLPWDPSLGTYPPAIRDVLANQTAYA